MKDFNNQGIRIPDVSFYQAIRRDQNNRLLPPASQKPIDFLRMKQAGIDAVVIRAGQDSYADSEFYVSWENAKMAGLARASYFFEDKDGDPKAQARKYWDIIKSDPGEGFISVDIEVGSHTVWDKWYQFINELQQKSGYPDEKIWIYTNLDTWKTYGPRVPASREWFAKYGLWLAAWVDNVDVNYPGIKVPEGLKTPCLLQYGTPSIGYSLGAWSREIDMNLFNGGQREFNEVFGTTTPTIPIPEVEPVPQDEPPVVIVTTTGRQYRCSATAGLNVRSGAGTSYPVLGALTYNEVVDEISVSGTWIQIKRSNGLVGWCSAQWLQLVPTIPPPVTGNRYTVVASVLNVRSSPTTTASVVGQVRYGEVVEEFEKNEDGSWIKVRCLTSLIGWCSAQWLRLINSQSSVTDPRLLPLAEFVNWQNGILNRNPMIRRVRKWGDPIMVNEGGFSTSLVGTSNFQAVRLYNKEAGFGGVTNYLRIPHNDVMTISAMQIEDNYVDKITRWLDQKMRWLYKRGGTIYFTDDDNDPRQWDTAPIIRWGTIALGGNLVQVEGYETIVCALENSPRRARSMARVKGFRKTDWGRPIGELLAEGLIHRCFCAYKGDSFGDSPKGIVYSPFFSPLDWDFAGSKQPTHFYIPASWLE